MNRLYMSLDDATDRVLRLVNENGGLFPTDEPSDKEWLRNELEQACEIRVCNLCRHADYTDEPFPVVTKSGRTIEAVFNFCPVCGRDLRPVRTDIWGGNE